MTTLTATKAREQLFRLIERTTRRHEAFEITSRNGQAVLISEEDYEDLIETLELLSNPGLLKSIRKAKKEIASGKTYSLKKVFKRSR
ncbi:MAG: type II toxin-antitoxin system Phd/YefM family antitoxin [Elusimicrobia bacterium]|nr:type II toxin-antitoxin system Phd/YefM family antitoxin [Elusimicrobiota bacterium]